jgi:hypothetical protein
MLAKLKEHWHELKSSRPGHRFQDRYYRRRTEHRGSFHWGRWLNILGGVLLLLVGLFMLAAPGPGLLVEVAGLSLLASEFLILARFLDWAEVRLRKILKPVLKWWAQSGWAIRASVLLFGLLLLGGAAYGGYALFIK